MANNNAIFNAVLSGAGGASQERWITAQGAGNYESFTDLIVAIATAVDIQIAPTTIDVGERNLMQAIAQGIFAGRYPVEGHDYSDIAESILALYTSMSAELYPEGGGSPGSLVSINPSDTTSNYLASKLGVGAGLSLTVLNPGGAEQLEINILTAFDITAFGLTGATLVLAGASVVSPGFSASYNQLATEVRLTDSDGHDDLIVLPGTAFVSPYTFTKNAYGANVTFSDNAIGPTGTGSDTDAASIYWGQNVYFGDVVDPGVYNNAFITSLAASLKLAPAGTYAYNASALESCFFCCRTAFALTSANFTVGGFPFACTRVATGVAVTNANGIVENYDVFKSDNMGLGSFNLVEA